jgi:hypothetical protein
VTAEGESEVLNLNALLSHWVLHDQCRVPDRLRGDEQRRSLFSLPGTTKERMGVVLGLVVLWVVRGRGSVLVGFACRRRDTKKCRGP